MQFIQTDLETVLTHLNKLDTSTKPLWGKMNAQQMVEHLTDSLKMATGQFKCKLEISEEKIEPMQGFLASDKPLPRDFKASFAPEHVSLRNEELELSVDEFVENWLNYTKFYEEHPTQKILHPYYGELNAEQWDRLNSKHLTHHFQQFGLLPIEE